MSYANKDCNITKSKIQNCRIMWRCQLLNRRCNKVCEPKPFCVLEDVNGNCTQNGWLSVC